MIEARRGTLAAPFEWYIVANRPGVLTIDMAKLKQIANGEGTLLLVDFRVKPGAAPGRIALDLQWVSLNDLRMTILPEPWPGADATDGAIDVIAPEVTQTKRGLLASLADGLRRLIARDPARAGAAEQYLIDIIGTAAVRITSPVDSVRTADPVVTLATSGASRDENNQALSSATSERKWLSAFVTQSGQPRPDPNGKLRVVLSPSASPKI